MMRAKFQVTFVQEHKDADGSTRCETVSMCAVAAKGYPADGSDDDNTYARWSPQADFKITIANPSLFGKFTVGDKFYADFTKAEG
jgi:hypothetical protein